MGRGRVVLNDRETVRFLGALLIVVSKVGDQGDLVMAEVHDCAGINELAGKYGNKALAMTKAIRAKSGLTKEENCAVCCVCLRRAKVGEEFCEAWDVNHGELIAYCPECFEKQITGEDEAKALDEGQE